MGYHEGVGIEPDLLVWINEKDSIKGVDRILETAIEIIELQ